MVVLADGRLVAAQLNEAVRIIDIATGAELWHCDGLIHGGLAVGPGDGWVYYTAGESIVAIDPNEPVLTRCTPKWSFDVAAAIPAYSGSGKDLVVGADDTVYLLVPGYGPVAVKAGVLPAAVLQWYQPSQGATRMLLGAGDRLFIGTDDARVLELEAATGVPVWSTALGFTEGGDRTRITIEAVNGLTLGPAASGGLLYVSHGEHISVVPVDSAGLLAGAWPMLRGNTANTGHAW